MSLGRAFALLFVLGCAADSAAQYYSVVELTPGDTYAEIFAGDSSTQGGTSNAISGSPHATVWQGTPESLTVLGGAPYSYTAICGIAGAFQVGYGTQGNNKALLWSGTSQSLVSLHPSGFLRSIAYGTDGICHVGFARQSLAVNSHAVVWTGISPIPVDIHPLLRHTSYAYDVQGPDIVGVTTLPEASAYYRAALWQSSGGTFIDLHPAGYITSSANSVWNGVQGGYANISESYRHAAIWSGSAGSFVDLHPLGAQNSEVLAVGQDVQVGYAYFASSGFGNPNPPPETGGAFAWRGTVSSAQNLDHFLPSWAGESRASAVDPTTGDIFGYCTDVRDFTHKALIWRAHRAGEPLVVQLTPARMDAALPSFWLTLDGSGFTPSSVVRWNGQNRPTTYVSPTRLFAWISSENIGQVGRFPVSVADAANGDSNWSMFEVEPTNIQPSVLTLEVGTQGFGSGLSQILASDNQYLLGWFRFHAPPNTPNLTWIIEAPVPSSTVSLLEVTYEVRANVAGMPIKLEAWDWASSNWHTMDSTTTKTVDTTRVVGMGSGSTTFRGPNGRCKVRLTFQQGISLTARLSGSIDFFHFRVTP